MPSRFFTKHLVFSTYVEVIPRVGVVFRPRQGILHVCGGDPNRKAESNKKTVYSPRMWR